MRKIVLPSTTSTRTAIDGMTGVFALGSMRRSHTTVYRMGASAANDIVSAAHAAQA